jgi:hypothetical protein
MGKDPLTVGNSKPTYPPNVETVGTSKLLPGYTSQSVQIKECDLTALKIFKPGDKRNFNQAL